MLDVRRLHMLRELSERGTIAATAQALGYSAPAVSQHLAALERQAGVSLLERQGRRVVLTPAARLLVGRTERVLAELEAAEAELADGDVRGSVRLAAFPTAAATLVPLAMASFAGRHPGAEVLLSELEPEDALPALKLGEVDLAVIHEYDFSPRGDDPSIELTALAEDPIHVAVPAGHAVAGPEIALEALADERWVAGYLDTACHRVVVTACRAAGSSRASWRARTTSASCWHWWPRARAWRSSRGSRSTASLTASASPGRPGAGSRAAWSAPCGRAAADIRPSRPSSTRSARRPVTR